MKSTHLAFPASAFLAMAIALIAHGPAAAQSIGYQTEDGLVRVPSSSIGLVYRAPDVSFSRYRRVMLDHVGVAFKHTWLRDNPQLKHDEVESLRADAAESFYEELVKEIVKRGKFELTTIAAPDVLRIRPYVIRMEINAPQAGLQPRQRTFVTSAGSMTLVVELDDAASGALIGRIVDGEATPELTGLQSASQVYNAAQARSGFARGAQLTHQAINVAQSEHSPPSVVPR